MNREDVKKYLRVDYNDDDELIEKFMNAADEELAASIDGYDKSVRSASQEIIICAMVMEMYDNRGLNGSNKGYSRMVRSMIDHEKYK
ncbi:MAG: head-tail connector protein [Eubacterium aggregans]|uniref:head-tail connector protein n=1 Tax=Eubacterium aggregans TaxID=81409 RepID=UPI002B1EBAA1|nr:head-tail connector protein [Eubacterium aggregans]MEA5073090.1 head-tail connector protein [Eubacterium aggregans]